MAKYAREYKWLSWVVYDMNYRQEEAGKPALPWAEAVGHREAKFFSQCFMAMAKDPHEGWCRACQSLDHSTSSCQVCIVILVYLCMICTFLLISK